MGIDARGGFTRISSEYNAKRLVEPSSGGIYEPHVATVDCLASRFPSVSMVDWNDGKPNPRYWVLKLLHDNFGPGDKLVEIRPDHPYVYSLAFVTRDGKRRVLLVNKRDRTFEVSIVGASGGQVHSVDQTTGFRPPATARLSSDNVKLGGFSVAVITLP